MIKKISILLILTFSILIAEEDGFQILNKHLQKIKKEERKEKIKSFKFTAKIFKYSLGKHLKIVDQIKVWRKGDSLYRLDKIEDNLKVSYFYNHGKAYFKNYLTKYWNISESHRDYKWLTYAVFDDDDFESSLLVKYNFDKYPLMFDSIVNINNRKYYKLIQLTDSVNDEINFYFDVETELFYFLERKFEGKPMYKRETVSYTMIDGFYFPKIVKTYYLDTLFFERVYDDIKINTKIDDRFFHPEPD